MSAIPFGPGSSSLSQDLTRLRADRPRAPSPGQHGCSYLSEAAARVLQDFQGVVGSLAFAVEFDVAGETFQFYLSKRE